MTSHLLRMRRRRKLYEQTGEKASDYEACCILLNTVHQSSGSPIALVSIQQWKKYNGLYNSTRVTRYYRKK